MVSSFIYVSTPDIISKTDSTIQSTTDYHQVFQYLSSFPEPAVDIETYVPLALKGRVQDALNPHTSNISLISIKPAEDENIIIFDWLALEQSPDFLQLMKDYLESRRYVICHNSSFELKFFKKALGKLFFNFWCTRVATQLIGNALGGRFYQQCGGYSLSSLCFNFLNIQLGGKGAEQTDDWFTRPVTPNKLAYSAQDVEYLHQLKNFFLPALTNPTPTPNYYKHAGSNWGLGLDELLDLEMQYISAEADMEYNGLPINSTINNLFQNGIYDEAQQTGIVPEIAVKLAKEFNYQINYDLITGKEHVTKDVISSLRSSQQLIIKLNQKFGKDVFKNAEAKNIIRLTELYDLLAKGETDPYYCDEEKETYAFLQSIEDLASTGQRDLLKLVSDFKKYTKQASMNLKKHINVMTKRIHPSFNSLGARTGRTTSSSPNGQNINSRTSYPIYIEKDKMIEYFTNLINQADSKLSNEI